MQLADFIVETIQKNKQEYVFGISGIPNLILYERLEKKVKCIQNVHEAHSIYSSMWAYLATWKVHFCIVTSGPGVTNCITPLAEAYTTNIPLVLISINNYTDKYGLGEPHDSSSAGGIDIVGITEHITSMSSIAMSATNGAYLLEKAYKRAVIDKKPTHISIPKNILGAQIHDTLIPREFPISLWNKQKNPSYNTQTFEEILTLLHDSKLTFLINLSEWLETNTFKKFIRKTKMPFANSMDNLNQFSLSPYCLGCFQYIQNKGIQKIFQMADTIIFIWSTIESYVVGDPDTYIWKTIIHIGSKPISYSEILRGKYIHILWDVNTILEDLRKKIEKKFLSFPLVQKLQKSIRKKYDKEYKRNMMYMFYKISNKCIPSWSSIFVSVGGVNNFANVFLRTKNPSFVKLPSSFFNMGQSMKIIGYAAYKKETPNFLFIGDGNFYMNGLDIITAVEQKMNINIILFNNKWYSSLIRYGSSDRIQQEYSDNFGKYNSGINMKKFADCLGIPYFCISQISDIRKMYRTVDLYKWVNLIEIELSFDTLVPLDSI